jgi:predicted P-loop ATPase
MPLITFFKNFNEPIANKQLEDTLKAIGSGAWKKQIEKLRECLAKGNQTGFEYLKKSLPAFTPSGLFAGGRKLEYLKQYSGFVILDIDKLRNDSLLQAKETAKQSKFCYACFTSPSGKGLKILVKVNSVKENHKTAFLQLQSHFEKLLNIEIDKSGKDITRLCFVSFDTEIYINTNADTFNCSEESRSLQDIYCDALQFTVKKESYTEGNRNNFIFLLANNLNRKGVSLNDALNLILSEYKYNDVEVTTTIKSAYNNSFEHAKNSPLNKGGKGVVSKHANNERTPTKNKRSFTANKFVLAQEYIKKHFVIRRNIVTQEYECRDINKTEFESMNENNIFIKMQISGLNLSMNNLIALLKSNFILDYNPFTEYFNNLPAWDGKTDYIAFLASFVKTKDRQRFDNHFKKWLVRVVACALVENIFNKQAFVLVHDKQNSGKSTFCRFLCPPVLQNYIAENLSIDKDSRILLCRNLLINLDELSTLSKVEINSLKSLFSKDKINERLPYDRRNSILPRRCSFIGSTNQVEFLNDETGSVRWLCFIIDEIDWNYSTKVNIDMVYAQAYNLFKNGFEYNLTQEEVKENDEYNKQFQILTSEKELINKFFRPGSKENHELFWTATDILLNLSHLTENKVKLSPVNIGRALKVNGFERVKDNVTRIYGYYIFRI